jgi:hypothetical protein
MILIYFFVINAGFSVQFSYVSDRLLEQQSFEKSKRVTGPRRTHSEADTSGRENVLSL